MVRDMVFSSAENVESHDLKDHSSSELNYTGLVLEAYLV